MIFSIGIGFSFLFLFRIELFRSTTQSL